MEQRQAEFAELRDKAERLLLDELPPATNPGSMCKLLLSVQPTFHNDISWTVFETEKDDDLVIRYTIWDKVFDGRRFRDPMEGLKYGWHTTPTIKVQTRKVSQPELRRLIESGRSLSPPVYTGRGIVIDGGRWFLKLHGAFENRLLSWVLLQDRDQEFAQWIKQVQNSLQDYFERPA